MNILDVIIVVIAGLAIAGGWQAGFLARILTWVGLGLGIYLGVLFGRVALRSMIGATQGSKLLVLVAIVAGTALVGQGVGLLLGSKVAAGTMVGPARLLDRAAGALLGLVAVLVLAWVLAPTLERTRGTVSDQARRSAIVQAINRMAPRQPAAIRNLSAELEGGWFPDVFSGGGPSPDAGSPPSSSQVSTAAVSLAEQSTVKVTGVACNLILDGSGFSALAPDLVVTNAHVVAGEPPGSTAVLTPTGVRLRATVVGFDERRDLALLAVPGLRERDPGEVPLSLDRAVVGTNGVDIGHPGGTDQVVVTPVGVAREVDAVGRDLYDQSNTSRDVYILSADIAQGDSGSPVIGANGDVEGVVFALAPDQPSTGYALSTSELQAAYNESTLSAVPTGPCLDS